jgi:hypothetical protein
VTNNLDGLSDVNTTTNPPSHGDILTYSASFGGWIPQALVAYLNDLIDVTISSPTTGQALVYNGTGWVNTTASTDPMNDSKFTAIITMDIGV